MGEEIAISLKNISKCYKRYARPVDRLKEILLPGKSRADTFWALRDLNLEIPKGQTIGIIGQNGSGKSTLLQIIAGTLTPTVGEVQVNGRVGALLELGSGFNPEFTGRQNVFFYGRLLGLSQREIEERFHKIAEFAEIGDFIDQPVKTYSSGMFVRLAFSVVTQVDADILIVDEALSVGDMYFQSKCIERMKMLKGEKTILYVSHSISSVRNFCDRSIWIRNGKMEKDGICSVVCEAYQDSVTESQEKLYAINNQQQDNNLLEKKDVVIKYIKTDKSSYFSGENITITLGLEFIKVPEKYGVGILIKNSVGDVVTLFNTIRDNFVISGIYETVKLYIPKNNFTRGTYFISVSLVDDLAMYPYDKLEYATSFFVDMQKNNSGIPVAEGYFRAEHEWIL
ncbi:ABC transporter ATP-binding protein [Nostoc sp. FACHB-152]|uniref:ABC transporter ATP-binding protein n=1 Tax=unclassified Nostoc TaxID=2593658 RepID=UPI001684643D|nr:MULTISPECIES: ABC transporter ATP-binding protein [unclassified Nostoc]MBD2445879.1 ABC transporter ATP-binding protein [Nostoc sp. FACHB-152]MBD2467945.1 ABC transporter ATP-binding protein [Nostoc sp. FACHB-145]